MAKKRFFQENELVFVEKPNHGKFHNIEGKKFGRLIVLGFAGRNLNSQWFCRCDCKNILKVNAGNLKNGHTTSCGCFNIERVTETKTTHGHKANGQESPTYKSWEKMLSRCNNPKDPKFSDYGARGIKVCERWKSFENFLADMGEKPKGLTIDRKENEKGYFDGNCRWATPKQQANNRRSNRILTFNGKTQNITQWAEELGINQGTLFSRIKRGWPIERALGF